MSSGALTPYRDDIKFFETVRICMAKWDAEERTARRLPIPADVSLLGVPGRCTSQTAHDD